MVKITWSLNHMVSTICFICMSKLKFIARRNYEKNPQKKSTLKCSHVVTPGDQWQGIAYQPASHMAFTWANISSCRSNSSWPLYWSAGEGIKEAASGVQMHLAARTVSAAKCSLLIPYSCFLWNAMSCHRKLGQAANAGENMVNFS